MDLPSFSFSKRLKSAKLHIALGGAAAVTYAAWTNSLSPDILTGLTRELINDPMMILTIIQEIDPLLIVPPFAVAGGLFVTLRATSRAGPALNRLKSVKSAGAKITSLAPQAAGSLSNSVTEQIKDKSGFFFSKKSGKAKHQPAQPGQSAPEAASSTKPTDKKNASADQGAVVGEKKNLDSKPAEQQASKAPENNNVKAINDLIEKKTTAVNEEIGSVKKEIESFRTDIDQMKSDLKQVTSTFESSLVELKAFQAEMINPINFMRKYIETLEIKNLSDPINTVRPIENPRATAPETMAPYSEPARPKPVELPTPQVDVLPKSNPGETEPRPSYEESQDIPQQDRQPRPRLPSDFKPRLVKKPGIPASDPHALMAESMRYLTPGKIMSIVSLIDEMLATMGPDGIELVIEQYRGLGMKPEEERLIYGVLRMLNESKLQTDDIIAIFYRFGQVMGINDEEAELQYMKLIANRKIETRGNTGAVGG